MRTTIYLILLTSIIDCSCSSSDVHRESDKIFHASSRYGGSIGGLYFGLYKDRTYQICATGGLGQSCYSGKFILNQDTLTLENLSEEIHLESNRLLIRRYDDQDSTYWKWKFSGKYILWEDEKWKDSQSGSGDIFQLDRNNVIVKNEQYFVIKLDSLMNYR